MNQLNIQIDANKKHIKNLSNIELSNDQINLLAKGLKFIPTPVTNQTQIKRQILRDFDQFARLLRLGIDPDISDEVNSQYHLHNNIIMLIIV